MWMGVYGTIGYFGMEIAMELFVGVMTISPKLIELEFQKLVKNIENNSINELQSRIIFRNIVQQITDIDE